MNGRMISAPTHFYIGCCRTIPQASLAIAAPLLSSRSEQYKGAYDRLTLRAERKRDEIISSCWALKVFDLIRKEKDFLL